MAGNAVGGGAASQSSSSLGDKGGTTSNGFVRYRKSMQGASMILQRGHSTDWLKSKADRNNHTSSQRRNLTTNFHQMQDNRAFGGGRIVSEDLIGSADSVASQSVNLAQPALSKMSKSH